MTVGGMGFIPERLLMMMMMMVGPPNPSMPSPTIIPWLTCLQDVHLRHEFQHLAHSTLLCVCGGGAGGRQTHTHTHTHTRTHTCMYG